MVDEFFDADAVLSGMSVSQLLALQEATEVRLSESAAEALSREGEDSLLGLLETRERVRRRGGVFDAALLVEISDRCVFRKAGYLSTHMLYAQGLRLGAGETRRRKAAATAIGRFTAMTGERREAVLPATAEAVADGVIGREHVAVIAEVMDKLPHSTDLQDRVKAEAMLADAARKLDPAAVTTVGNRILAWLDPDGSVSDDKDRRRRRTFVLQPQSRLLMRKVRAQLTPMLQAKLEVVLTQWAARGMNNPDDPDSPSGAADQPGLDPGVLAAAAERDDRSIGQRQHDALEALCEWALALAGQPAPERIPSQVVVTVSDEDLARQAGIAWTATGTRLPVTDLVRLAAHATPYLAVFGKAWGQCLYLGRARFASAAQRLALFARDRGCTAPGCTAPFTRTQIHHMPDYADGGLTDIDKLGGACGSHNRWVGKQAGQWQTEIIATGPDAGRVGWRPVGRSGPWQVNPLFHPEKLRTDTPTAGMGNRLGGDSPPPGAGPPATDENTTPSGSPSQGTHSVIEERLEQMLAA